MCVLRNIVKVITIIKELPDFLKTLKLCLDLSLQTSKFYTLMRILTEILMPVVAIIIAFIGRIVINVLVGQAEYAIKPEHLLLILLGSLCLIALIRRLSGNVTQYYRMMHDDMMSAKVAIIIMDHALKADLEHFDNPEYYDKLNSANRDSYAINNVAWSTISIVSSTVSFVIAFVVLSQMSFIYGIALLVASIPASIVAATFTKTLYFMSLEQINSMRQMGYVQGISSEQSFSQKFRLFNVGKKLMDRYKRIWKGLYNVKRKASRKRTIFVSILECMPEVVIALIGIDIAFRVLSGSATVGDYSLFLGLTAQLWSAISMFSMSAMQIYYNRMKLDNFKSISDFKNTVADNGDLVLESVEAIKFSCMSFTYPGAKVKALDELSINF
jgi:ABC-type multidrug transport system fused ATPase/permease subunit